jgi:hypothetical protein
MYSEFVMNIMFVPVLNVNRVPIVSPYLMIDAGFMWNEKEVPQ